MITPIYFPWDITAISIAGDIGNQTAIVSSASGDDTDPVTLVAEDFDGDLAGGPYSFTRSVTVLTGSAAGSYNTTDPIVVTGTDVNGNIITENLTLVTGDGNDLISGVKAFKTVTQIDIPVQNDTSGTFSFGVRDVFISDLCLGIRVGSNGDLKITSNSGVTDIIPNVAPNDPEMIFISPQKIWGDSDTTAQDLTVFIKK